MSELQEQLQLAKERDEKALAFIITKEMPMIRAYAWQLHTRGLEYDDAVQYGLIALFDAIETFDQEKASFHKYAGACVKNAILSARRAACAKRNLPMNEAVPLEETVATDGPEQIADYHETCRIMARRIDAELSAFERKIVRYKIRNANAKTKEIAQWLGCDRKTVDNALFRIRRKLGDDRKDRFS